MFFKLAKFISVLFFTHLLASFTFPTSAAAAKEITYDFYIDIQVNILSGKFHLALQKLKALEIVSEEVLLLNQCQDKYDRLEMDRGMLDQITYLTSLVGENLDRVNDELTTEITSLKNEIKTLKYENHIIRKNIYNLAKSEVLRYIQNISNNTDQIKKFRRKIKNQLRLYPNRRFSYLRAILHRLEGIYNGTVLPIISEESGDSEEFEEPQAYQ